MRNLKLCVNKIAVEFVVLILFINISTARKTFSIYEGRAPGEIVGNLNITANIHVIYPKPAKFDFDKSTGVIKSTVTLDREEKSLYKFTVVTNDGPVAVHIVVKDINDETPTFSSLNLTEQISEGYPAGHIYDLRLRVTDKDESVNGIHNNSVNIISGNVGNVFKIHLKKRDNYYAVSLELTKKLNWTAEHKYILNLSASDTGTPRKTGYMKLTLIVEDYNDCRPQFSRQSYSTDVSESVQQGTRVLNITTSDCDGGKNAEVVYRMNYDSPYDKGRFFSIQQKGKYGYIVTNLNLDYEKTKTYRLQVIATDKGTPPNENRVDLTVFVHDENDNAPEIGRFSFCSIDEDAKVDSRVAKIKIHDKDSGKNGMLNVSLDAMSSSVFSIVKSTLAKDSYEVYLKRSLDYEKRKIYHIIVTATDNGKPPQTFQNSGSLLIGDVNDNPPMFVNDTYTCEIMESAKPGTRVLAVNATDIDQVSKGKITYRILLTNYSSWFHVNSTTRVIYVATSIDREQSDKVTLVIEAYDGKFSANCTVIVNIIDSNDNAPQFSMPHYTMTVLENLPVGMIVGQVVALDPDLTSIGHVSFSLAQNITNVFTINNSTGNITTLVSLDREQIDMYNFTVAAHDEGGLQSTAMVTVIVGDINDHRPFFKKLFYNCTVFENESVSSDLVKLEADDHDIGWNAEISYEINSGNTDGSFALDKSNGQISVNRKLDREKVDYYVLKFRAIDYGGLISQNLATVEILVKDVNDDPPEFQKDKYTFSVKENDSKSVLVGIVMAKSYDQGSGGIISYSIITYDALQDFAINDSGAIFTKRKMDHEIKSEYELLVQAKDHGTPTLFGYVKVTVVVIDINDNTPVWNDYNHCIKLLENYPVGDKHVFHVFNASDKDSELNGRVTYSMVSGPISVFNLNSATGYLSLNMAVDYEHVHSYHLTVNASDSGHPVLWSLLNVNICIIDENDNAPVLHNSSISVSEDYPINALIYTFLAMDKDSGKYGKVWYKFDDNISPSTFVLSRDGKLTLKSSLDRENQSRYEVYILAGDYGTPHKLSKPAKLIIHVTDVNDEAPIFTPKLSFSTDEEQSSKTFIGKIEAKDRDLGNNSEVEYVLVNFTDTFEIDSKTGELFNIVKLDREVVPVYRIKVLASDKGDPPKNTTATVSVYLKDINDNSPKFTDVFAEIPENAIKGKNIAQVKAEDIDAGENGEVIYYLSTGNVQSGVEFFQINETTGFIYIVTPLDREIKEFFVLSVVAYDKGHPPRDSIGRVYVTVLDVNDHKPEFKVKNDTIYISERTPVGSVVYRANATDQDKDENGNIMYSIVKVSREPVFGINAKTGAVILNRTLDYEHTKQYSLRIRASDKAKDNPKKSILRLYINILDSNDNSPIFAENPIFAHIYENVPRGTKVGKPILASDKDSGINSRIVYTIESQSPKAAFKIDPFKAQLTTDVEIDREDVAEYKLVVKAADQAADISQQKSETVTVIIVISDLNDNAPVFTSLNDSFIMEDEPVNYTVFFFTAEDKDLDQAGNVTFSVIEGNEHGMFYLDPYGYLILLKPLDREKVDIYLLKIKASDQGSLQLFSTITFTLSVEDVNDNMPRFSNYIYKVNVPENTRTNILKVEATDLDSGQLNYTLPPGFADDLFIIDETSGQVSTSSPLDREKNQEYKLTVYVQDNGYPLHTDSATVIINVTDENDNVPYLLRNRYEVKVFENRPAGFICSIVGEDSDSGVNARLLYIIENGNDLGYFLIDQNTGIISNVRPLDREVNPVNDLIIRVKDLGQPSFSTTVNVSIIVLDENDNNPKFPSSEKNISLPGGSQPGATVVTLTATDDDEASNTAITYSFGDDYQIPFGLDSTTGRIYTLNYLNSSKIDTYSFLVNASDGSKSGARYGSIKVNVFVGHVTGVPLQFTKVLYEVDLLIQPKAGMEILHLQLKNHYIRPGDVEYTREDGQDVLAVGSSGGNVSFTQDPKPGAYLFSVKATLVRDQSITAVCFVVVTVQFNIKRPRFSELNYYATLNETDPRGTSVVTVKPDTPGNVSYQILNNNAFNIDANGEVTVQKTDVLDFEKSPNFELDIKGDWGNTITNIAFTKVHVALRNLNDKAPVFRQKVFVASIPECNSVSLDNRAVIKLLAFNFVNSRMSFEIVSGNDGNVFLLDSRTGELTFRGPVDREEKRLYNLTVIVSSGVLSSKCTVLVFVTDINNNPPQLPEMINFTIAENSPLGTQVGQVNATDKDEYSIISYRFSNNKQQSGPFIIDPYTGILSLVDVVDFEAKSNVFSMDVSASDQAHETRMKIFVNVLDENDHPPLFEKSSYIVKRKETIPAQSHLARINATDKDQGINGRITYDITFNEEVGIDPDTGNVFAKKELRYRKDIIDLIITATDQGSPILFSQAPFRLQILDVNNKTPVFGNATSYDATISEDTEIGTVVVTIKAINSESLSGHKRISFQILHGDELKMFRMEERTGVIRVQRKLDRETNDLYNLLVIAQDERITVRIKIDDVNDNAPTFQSNKYYINGSMYERTISEDTKPPSLVLRVHATDKDIGRNSKIRYSISSGNIDEWFSVNDRGELSLVKPVDRDVIPIHRLSVRATDQGTPPKASDISVVIKVYDINDNAPVFMQPKNLGVAENVPSGSHAGTIRASDSDSGANQNISFSLINGTGLGLFNIDETTGSLTTTVPFDYEEKSSYTLVVKAQDQGKPPRSSIVPIVVPVIGVDEFEPKFLKSSYMFFVSAGAKKDDIVGQVHATDSDGGLEGVIKYELDSNATLFAINSSFGEIYLTKDVVDRYEHSRKKRDTDSSNKLASFSLTISASSGQLGSKISTVTARVFLNNTSLHVIGQPDDDSFSPIKTIIIAISIVAFLALIVFLIWLFVQCKRKKVANEKKPSEEMVLRPIPSQFEGLTNKSSYAHVSTSACNSLASTASSSSENRSSDTGYAGHSKQVISSTMEDSGIQPDSDYLSPLDTDNECSDTRSFDVRSDKTERLIAHLGSIESLHDFDDEGGREASAGLDVGNLLFAKLAEADAEEDDQNVDRPLRFHDEGRPDYTGSLSSILGSHEELRGHYNYFYALNQGPQYQPLSEVFSEIGRLPNSGKDLGSHLNGVNDLSARTSLLSSVSSLHNQHLDPESTYSSLPMTPNFTPAITPLVTRSPSLSPLTSEAVTPMVSPSQSRPSSMYLPRSRPSSSLIQLAERDVLDNLDEDVHV